MSNSWSSKLSREFSITLSPALIEWFDQGLWKRSYSLEFGEPIKPDMLFYADSSTVWGGLMLPDTLPILGDGCGDVISLRFDENGSVDELVCWWHETGNWNPIGQSLSEVFLFDAALSLSRGCLEREDDVLKSSCIDWAIKWTTLASKEKENLKRLFATSDGLEFRRLLDFGLAEIPVSRILTECHLQSGLLKLALKQGGQSVARQIRARWDEFRPWLYDPRNIPKKYTKRLAKIFDISSEELLYQDWAAAEGHARKVLLRRTDLGWPFAVLGQAAERRHDTESAIKHYLSGMRALGTTYDFTQSWSEQMGCPNKYCAQRLLTIERENNKPIPKDPYTLAATSSDIDAIFNYWRSEAEMAERKGDNRTAYDCWYLAGWDDLSFDNMEVILDSLVRASQNAGYTALHRLATHHKESFTSRS